MSRRPYFAAVCLLSALALSPAVSAAQASRPAHITIEWQNAALSDVVTAMAKFSGRSIVVSSDVKPAVVTFAAHDVEWPTALHMILEQQALVARTDTAGVIHVENRVVAAPEKRS